MKTEREFIKQVRAFLKYDPVSGQFTWAVWRGGGSPRVGSKAGFISSGYIKIRIYGRNYGAHRLAWMFVYGVYPQYEIDHRDGDPSNNRIDNLRDVPHAVNQHNRWKARKDSRIGFIGVTKNKSRFSAAITVNGKRQILGTFTTPEEANAAYFRAKQRLHPRAR